jgi:hypothetical protein
VYIEFLGLHVYNNLNWNIIFFGSTAPSGPWPPLCWGIAISLRYNALSRTLLDEWSARRRDLYLSSHNIRNRQKSMSPVGFEMAIPASERLQTHAIRTRGHGDRLNWKMCIEEIIHEWRATCEIVGSLFVSAILIISYKFIPIFSVCNKSWNNFRVQFIQHRKDTYFKKENY